MKYCFYQKGLEQLKVSTERSFKIIQVHFLYS